VKKITLIHQFLTPPKKEKEMADFYNGFSAGSKNIKGFLRFSRFSTFISGSIAQIWLNLLVNNHEFELWLHHKIVGRGCVEEKKKKKQTLGGADESRMCKIPCAYFSKIKIQIWM
jgi:hypothetical protein